MYFQPPKPSPMKLDGRFFPSIPKCLNVAQQQLVITGGPWSRRAPEPRVWKPPAEGVEIFSVSSC